jgi:hypothetical protein|tara:strand:+ start:358 stop:564 length:207 start_codon:yes stop_codon:yes gene_type:complete
MKKLTINDRLLESITNKTDNFRDTNLSKTTLLEISKKLIDYVIEVDTSYTQEGSAAKSFENDLYHKIK